MSYKVPTRLEDIPTFLASNLELCDPCKFERTVDLIEPAVRKGLNPGATEAQVIEQVGVVFNATVSLLTASKSKRNRLAGMRLQNYYDD